MTPAQEMRVMRDRAHDAHRMALETQTRLLLHLEACEQLGLPPMEDAGRLLRDGARLLVASEALVSECSAWLRENAARNKK